jgi:hypothetical protein
LKTSFFRGQPLDALNEKAETERFRAVSAGILEEKAGMTVAKVIEFYTPKSFRKSVRWASPEQRGKIIEFALPIKKSA